MMYQMAAYCRLSKDDGENKISESIENQMKLIREYAGKSNDLEIADIYILMMVIPDFILQIDRNFSG